MNPEDMSGGTGLPGGGEEVAEAWIGRKIRITLQGPASSRGASNETVPGVLQGVNAWGVHSAEGDTSLKPTFYPWSAVRRITLCEQDEAEQEPAERPTRTARAVSILPPQ